MSECLNSLAKIYYGKSPNEVISIDGQFPIMGTGGVYGKANRFMFSAGIVVARKGSLGKPHLLKIPFWPVDTTYAVIPNSNVDIEWLYYCLLNFDLNKLNEATGVPSISRTWLEKIKFHSPDYLKQQKIAAILTTVDTAIEKTEALIEKYQQIKAGLMHDLFTRGVLPNGKLRPPREQAPELYQETAVGWIPKEWSISGLQDNERPGTNFIKTGPFGSSLKGEHWVDHGHPVITIGALGEAKFIESELLFVNDKNASRLADFQLKTGDVVFSRVADVGRSIVIRKENSGWIMSSNLMRIAVNENKVLPDIVQMQLAYSRSIKSQIKAKVNSSGRDVANSEILRQLKFSWPQYDEQKLIIERANLIENQIVLESSKLEKLQMQKLGLMQDLLTGTVEVRI